MRLEFLRPLTSTVAMATKPKKNANFIVQLIGFSTEQILLKGSFEIGIQ